MVRFIGESLVTPSGGTDRVWTTRIATAFPHDGVVVTVPGIHATQRALWVEEKNRERASRGEAELSAEQRSAIWLDGVDLLLEGDTILIRPDGNRMDLAFAADVMLQSVAPRTKIKFLNLQLREVRDAIYRRGEAWRIQPLPRKQEEMRAQIQSAWLAVKGLPIYCYSKVRGTRILTRGRFASLGGLDETELRVHLGEIACLARSTNLGLWPELELFMTEDRLTARDLLPAEVESLDSAALRRVYEEACSRYAAATPVQFQQDDVDDVAWCNHMFRALIAKDDATLADEDLLGLSDEYYMQIHWLPGARTEQGELIVDTTPSGNPREDAVVHELICNLMREHGEIEFVNMGRVVRSLSRRAPTEGRREVYVAQFRMKGSSRDELHVIRFQKWGVGERLDKGEPILQAMMESDEYTDYILDRRLACRQLGMNVTARVWSHRIEERYDGKQRSLAGATIRSPYMQREYVPGMATDKVPRTKLRDRRYAQDLAKALGKAAAASLIVGRANTAGQVIFDDGDELIIEGSDGRIVDIVVSDPTGAFANYREELAADAPAYARPVRDRLDLITDGEAFEQDYLESFVHRFQQIQRSYRNRRHAFDSLFRHRRRDPAGNLAHRWAMVLSRLDRSDGHALARIIRASIRESGRSSKPAAGEGAGTSVRQVI